MSEGKRKVVTQFNVGSNLLWAVENGLRKHLMIPVPEGRIAENIILHCRAKDRRVWAEVVGFLPMQLSEAVDGGLFDPPVGLGFVREYWDHTFPDHDYDSNPNIIAIEIDVSGNQELMLAS